MCEPLSAYMHCLLFYSFALIIIANTVYTSSPYPPDANFIDLNHLQPYQQYTFHYESYEYALHSVELDETNDTTGNTANDIPSYVEKELSATILIDSISIRIVKSASRPYQIQLTSPNASNESQPISFFYDDDNAFNTVQLWNAPHRHRRRLRTCRYRRWSPFHYSWRTRYCPP
eukprot:846527_1